MNKILLQGVIRNIRHGYAIKRGTSSIDYDCAELLIKNKAGRESLINLKFRHSNCVYKDGETIICSGNIRTFSQRQEDNKNHVEVYVYTYFDPVRCYEDSELNVFHIDGNICKKQSVHTCTTGSKNLQFIVANNIIRDSVKLNNYLPCVTWNNDLIDKIDSKEVGDYVSLSGELHSREYTKDVNGVAEIHVVHELVVNSEDITSEDCVIDETGI